MCSIADIFNEKCGGKNLHSKFYITFLNSNTTNYIKNGSKTGVLCIADLKIFSAKILQRACGHIHTYCRFCDLFFFFFNERVFQSAHIQCNRWSLYIDKSLSKIGSGSNWFGVKTNLDCYCITFLETRRSILHMNDNFIAVIFIVTKKTADV